MIQFVLLFALLGLVAVAAWGWSRRHRREKGTFTPVSPPARSPVPAELKTIEARDKGLAPTTQTLETVQPVSVVASPESVGDPAVAAPSEANPALSRSEPNNVPPEQAAKSLPTDSQLTGVTAAMPTPVADALPKSPPVLETQVFTLTETINANGQPAHVETSISQCISSELVADDEEQRSSPLIVVPTKSNVIEAEHAVVPIVDAVEATVPSETPSEAGEDSDSCPVQTVAITNSRPAMELPPSIENEQPIVEALPQQSSEVTIPTKLPDYRPLAPVSPAGPSRPRRPANIRPAPNTNAELRLRMQLVFGRGGGVKTMALVPDRREGMPDEVEITGMQGELRLTEPLENCYRSVPLADAGNALRQGVEWRGNGDARHWRWILSRRELYVLAPGDEFGLSGFVSTARLLLNARHVVLAMAHLRNEVLAALAETGSATPEVNDDTTPGVPFGWLLFRDVTPTRAVPMRDEAHILNALCPLPDIEPHFVGGIRLERRTWLVGFPPRIRFTGALGDDFRPMIDGQVAQLAMDGAFEAPGWDNIEEHRLWFGGQTEAYSVRMMDESWESWRAHDFGAGTAICGAMTHPPTDVQRQQVQVPVTSPLLLGARPGEIFHCHPPSDVRCETVRTLVPFAPVWALPVDPSHADKRSARILLLQPTEPVTDIQLPRGNRVTRRALVAWISAIRQAGRKGLVLAVEGKESKALWQRYRNAAKQLRRKMR